MILDIVKSINDVPIRLTDERWEHISIGHPYMSGFYEVMLQAVENPEFLLRGEKKSKIGILNTGRRRWLHVVYREINKNDGFIISAFINNDFNRDKIIWSRQN